MGPDFRGVYNRFDQYLPFLQSNSKQTIGELVEFKDLEDPEFQKADSAT